MALIQVLKSPFSWTLLDFCLLNETETEWLSFLRRQLTLHIPELKLWISIEIPLHFNNIQALDISNNGLAPTRRQYIIPTNDG